MVLNVHLHLRRGLLPSSIYITVPLKPCWLLHPLSLSTVVISSQVLRACVCVGIRSARSEDLSLPVSIWYQFQCSYTSFGNSFGNHWSAVAVVTVVPGIFTLLIGGPMLCCHFQLPAPWEVASDLTTQGPSTLQEIQSATLAPGSVAAAGVWWKSRQREDCLSVSLISVFHIKKKSHQSVIKDIIFLWF